VIVKRIFDEIYGIPERFDYPMITGPGPDEVRCVFLAFSTIVPRARSLCIVSSIAALGNWNPRSGQKMGNTTNLQAMATVDVEKNTFPFEFKHVALGGNQVIQ